MIKRILEVSSSGTYLSIKHQQLVLKLATGETHSASCEDIGALIIDNPAVTFSTAVVNSITEAGGCIVVCGKNHLPTTLMLPIEANTLQGERFRRQSDISKPLCKKLWAKIIVSKIQQQAIMLESIGKNSAVLVSLAKRVRSGDPANIEAQAARHYWKPLLGSGFSRHREGKPPNNLLNYGYTVLRAIVARAICGTGLHPTLGLHHKNKYNAFALADDLMEPYRPLVDQSVLEYLSQNDLTEDINRDCKAKLLGMLHRQLYFDGKKEVVQIAIQHTAESLSKSIMSNRDYLKLPNSLMLEQDEE
jgi:CRISP-associated protein Cas1